MYTLFPLKMAQSSIEPNKKYRRRQQKNKYKVKKETKANI